MWRKPKVALEIGVEGGLCSLYMTMAAKEYDGMVIGIDINDFARKPHDNYYFIKGDSTNQTTFNKVLHITQELGPIGVVFQDSSHHYEASKQEWALYSQLLDKNSIWVCDDISPSFHDPLIDPPGMGMVQYFEGLPGSKRLYPYAGSNSQGIVLYNNGK